MKLAPKILILLLGVGIVIRSLLMVWEIFQTRQEVLQQNIELHRVLLSSNVESFAASVYNVEDKRLEVLVSSMFELGEVSQIWIYEEDGVFYKGYSKTKDGIKEMQGAPEPSPFDPFSIDKHNPIAPYSASSVKLLSQPYQLSPESNRIFSTLWVSVNDTPVFTGHLIIDFVHLKSDALLASEIRTKIVSGLTFVSLLIVVIFIFLRRTVISRITYLEHASSQLASRNFENFRQDQGNDEVASLNRSFFQMASDLKNYSDNLEVIVQERTQELKASRDRVALILDNIDQGIVTINGAMEIEKEYSSFITSFYQIDDPTGKDVFKTLFPMAQLSHDEMDQVRQALLSILEMDELCWIANHNKLITELTIFINGQERNISLDWKAIIDEDEIIHKMMITVRDVTEAKKLHKKLAEEETRTKIIIEIIKARQSKRNFNLTQTLDAMRDKLLPQRSIKVVHAEQIKQFLTILHTIKGESRTIGYRILSQHVHNAEGVLKEESVSLIRYHDIAREILALLEVYDNVIQNLFEAGQAEHSQHPNILSAISDGLLDLSKRLMEHGIPLSEVTIQDELDDFQDSDAWTHIRSIFVHSMNNVADHGFIHPHKKNNVPMSAKLLIRGFIQEGHVHISIQDNGAGLNFDRLREKAKQNNMQFDPSAPENVLFLGGISTADAVSNTSGRGVGMRAIHDLAMELDGKVTLRQNPSGGTILTLILPVTMQKQLEAERAI